MPTALKPTLFIICGYVGAGKTTTAKKLSRLIKAPVASVDATLLRILERPSFFHKDQPPSRTELTLCYKTFSLLADYLLGAGSSVIIDGAFAKRWQRKLIIDTAKKHRAPHYIIHIICPDEILIRRASRRFAKGKGVGIHAYKKIKKLFEPITTSHFTVDTSKNVDRQLKDFLKTYQLK